MHWITIKSPNTGTATSFSVMAATLTARLAVKRVSFKASNLKTTMEKTPVSVSCRRLWRYHQSPNTSAGDMVTTLATTPVSVSRHRHWHQIKCQFRGDDTANETSVVVMASTLATTQVPVSWPPHWERHQCQCSGGDISDDTVFKICDNASENTREDTGDNTGGDTFNVTSKLAVTLATLLATTRKASLATTLGTFLAAIHAALFACWWRNLQRYWRTGGDTGDISGGDTCSVIDVLAATLATILAY